MKETSQERARRTPPGQVLTTKWPVLTYGRTPRFDPRAGASAASASSSKR
jgi:hypothetical protein